MTELEVDFDARVDMAIGAVARALVDVEAGVRSLLMDALPDADAMASIGGLQFARLLERCRKHLGELDLPAEVNRLTASVLDCAEEAGAARNRAVHDLWLSMVEEGSADVTVSGHQYKKGNVGPEPTGADLAWLEAALELNRRAAVRLIGLRYLVQPYAPRLRGVVVWPAERVQMWVDTAEGKFDLVHSRGTSWKLWT